MILSVYNLQGKLIKTIFNHQMKSGQYSVSWNGKETNGQLCKPGIYFVILKTNTNSVNSLKIVII